MWGRERGGYHNTSQVIEHVHVDSVPCGGGGAKAAASPVKACRSGREAQSMTSLSLPGRWTAENEKLYRNAVSHSVRSSPQARGSRVRMRLSTWTSDSLSTVKTTCESGNTAPYSTAVTAPSTPHYHLNSYSTTTTASTTHDTLEYGVGECACVCVHAHSSSRPAVPPPEPTPRLPPYPKPAFMPLQDPQLPSTTTPVSS